MRSLGWSVWVAVFWCAAALGGPTIISMDGKGIVVDGKQITSVKKTKGGSELVISLKAAEAALGPSSRTQDVSDTKCFYFWDSCGIKMGSWNDVILAFTVNFSPAHFVPKESPAGPSVDSQRELYDLNKHFVPQADYDGTVLFHGLTLTKKVRIGEIEGALRKQSFTFDLSRREAEFNGGSYQLYVTWQEDDQTLSSCFLLITKR